VVATSGEVLPQNGTLPSVPDIGRAIDNYEVYVVDEQLRPVPAGQPGELLIGGAGVARGYLNLPATKDERGFLADPFHPEQQAYRTGDLVRQSPERRLEFLGRKDDQIKIRGFRVEPAEIVAALKCYAWVKDAAVISRPGSSAHEGRELVAYLVPRAGAELSRSEIVGHLAQRLPDYMMPREFVTIAALPLTAHGKIDRARLPNPHECNRTEEASVCGLPGAEIETGTECEKRLAAIISNLLNIGQLGYEDCFFLLGWHTLLGPQLIARIRESFGVTLTLGHLFDAPTVPGLAGHIARLVAEQKMDRIPRAA
jgi:hypothetical protein